MLNFTIRQLEVFVVAAENQSFTVAANKLNLAQSTVSAHIKGLEDSLDVLLFVRDAKKQIYLTETGHELYERAKAIVEQCQIVEDDFSKRTKQQPIAIAASTDSFEYLLPGVMAEYMRSHGQNPFNLVSGDSAFVHDQIISGHSRIGFSGTAMNKKELQYMTVCKDHLVMIAPNTEYYRNLQKKGKFGRDLLNEPMIVRTQSSGTKKEFDHYLERNNLMDVRLHIVATMNQAEAVKNSVANGIGVAVISELAAQRYLANGTVLMFPMDESGAVRNIYLLYRKDTVFSQAEQSFISFAVEHIRNDTLKN